MATLNQLKAVWQPKTLQTRMKSWQMTITLQAVVVGSVRVVRAKVTPRALEIAASPITSQAKVTRALAEAAGSLVNQKVAQVGETTRAAKVIKIAVAKVIKIAVAKGIKSQVAIRVIAKGEGSIKKVTSC